MWAKLNEAFSLFQKFKANNSRILPCIVQCTVFQKTRQGNFRASDLARDEWQGWFQIVRSLLSTALAIGYRLKSSNSHSSHLTNHTALKAKTFRHLSDRQWDSSDLYDCAKICYLFQTHNSIYRRDLNATVSIVWSGVLTNRAFCLRKYERLQYPMRHLKKAIVPIIGGTEEIWQRAR